MNKSKILESKKFLSAFTVLLSMLFAAAMTQASLFSSNQNTYLLQGTAQALGAPLSNDWLANQTDHIPLFTWLIKTSYLISPLSFYLYHYLLTAILAFSLYKISKYHDDSAASANSIAIFFLLTFLAGKILGVLDGVAGQSLLGYIFQPSVFGVLLMVSIACFQGGKNLSALFYCLLAAYFHPTYILQAAFLILTYQFILLKTKRLDYIFLLGLIALIAISPLLYSLYDSFGRLPPEVIKRSQEILVYERIPHHALVNEWFSSKKTAFSFALITLAVIAYRRNRDIVLLLTIPALISIIFVLIANFTNNLTMLLLFGQRSSVWLVPLASSLLIIKLSSQIQWHSVLNLQKSLVLLCAVSAMTVFSIRGVSDTAREHYKKANHELYKVLASLDYSNGSLLVPPNHEDIRLNAKVPIFIDWKSHPYKANEVIEWHSRVLLAKEFYESSEIARAAQILNKINEVEPIRYVITDSSRLIGDCHPIYQNEEIQIYQKDKCF
jgi:hypothetical protein